MKPTTSIDDDRHDGPLCAGGVCGLGGPGRWARSLGDPHWFPSVQLGRHGHGHRRAGDEGRDGIRRGHDRRQPRRLDHDACRGSTLFCRRTTEGDIDPRTASLVTITSVPDAGCRQARRFGLDDAERFLRRERHAACLPSVPETSRRVLEAETLEVTLSGSGGVMLSRELEQSHGFRRRARPPSTPRSSSFAARASTWEAAAADFPRRQRLVDDWSLGVGFDHRRAG